MRTVAPRARSASVSAAAAERENARSARKAERPAGSDAVKSWTLEWFDVEASSRRPPHATVELRTPDGELARGDFTGDGPVDAIFRAINAAAKREARLREFHIGSVTGGQDALGEASVVLELAGQSAAGQGVSTDIIEAAALAYVRALSNAERRVLAAAETPPVETAEAELTPTP